MDEQWFSKLNLKKINLLILQFGEFQKFPKFYNFANHKISIIEKLIK